ncbi:hypothetical protein MSBRW_3700 [Methanosarcina barkeri str. Wiesmoor]|uniref:DUF6398 domain-containing protein n=2 Tax=Methanosarcina barkeri TaxID=2208 RepID=A0A0E3QQK4_METBA|nr:DUF6398 domain-containing protein [Methanosarcina barkeri]AKB52953.1 hypothetical protein MSBRW_3700 [Methanosarcina barkeri str. Wiesmoor]
MTNRELVQQKKDTLIQMTDGFADSYLDEDYKMLCRKLINKMSRKRQVPFLSGRLDIWAAAVVYALGQINFLFDRSSEPYVSATDLCDYFGTSQSTTSQKAKKIRDMFKIRHFNDEFSTERVQNENPFNDFVMVNGLIVPVSTFMKMLENREVKLRKELELEDEDLETEEK